MQRSSHSAWRVKCESADAIPTPGVATSGFSTPSRRGPRAEKFASSPTAKGS